MSFARPFWVRPMALLLLLPLLGGSKCRRVKDGDDGTDTDGNTDRPEDIARGLTVVSVEPSQVPAMQASTVEVLGSGFTAGARVLIGTTQADRATVIGSTRVEARLPPLATGTYDVEVQNPDGQRSTLRGALTVGGDARGDCSSLTVFFDLDSNTLRGDAVSLLTEKADCLAQATGRIRIEGHCDDRGTTDYNLALGQRRADAVQRWLAARGIPTSRLQTVSFGEERPAVDGSNEAAWAANRRAVLLLER